MYIVGAARMRQYRLDEELCLLLYLHAGPLVNYCSLTIKKCRDHDSLRPADDFLHECILSCSFQQCVNVFSNALFSLQYMKHVDLKERKDQPMTHTLR